MAMKIIDEQLEDKQQIVTYKYLIEKLNIHPNKAKELLKDYVAQISDDKKYSITVVIGGTLQKNDEFCIVLVYNDHVKTVRRRFKHISFEHFYSIQPISRFDDMNNALYLVDNTLNININLPSSIKMKEKKNAALFDQSNVMAMEIDNVALTKEIKPMLNVASNHENVTKLDEAKLTQKNKTVLNGSSNSEKNKNKKLEITEKVSPKKNNSDFFSKFKKSNNSPKNSHTEKGDSFKESSVDKVNKKDDKKIMDVESPKKKVQDLTNETQTKNKKKTNKKKENVNKSSQKVKRKRIQTFNSSDEEIDSEEEDKKRSDLVMDVEDEVDLVLPTPPRQTPRENRKKEKKTTTSTFIDDDGFVCTTKEVQIVETECEPIEPVGNTENSVPNTSNTNPASKKVKPNEPVEKKKNKNKQSKNSSSHGMKQSSLTSFFKTK